MPRHNLQIIAEQAPFTTLDEASRAYASLVNQLNESMARIEELETFVRSEEGQTFTLSGDMDLAGKRIRNLPQSRFEDEPVSRRELRDITLVAERSRNITTTRMIEARGGVETPTALNQNEAVNLSQLTAQSTLTETLFLRKDGTVALTADWDAGPFRITAETFTSDVGIGTAPISVTSTTVCPNLNADTVDGVSSASIVQTTGSQTAAGAKTWSDAAVFSSTIAANGNVTMGNNALIARDVNSGLTASTTQTQADGLDLTAEVNEVSTVANTNDTVVLPTAVAGLKVVIINNGAQSMRIFPASGDNLGAGVDTQAGTALPATNNRVYTAFDATNWESSEDNG